MSFYVLSQITKNVCNKVNLFRNVRNKVNNLQFKLTNCDQNYQLNYFKNAFSNRQITTFTFKKPETKIWSFCTSQQHLSTNCRNLKHPDQSLVLVPFPNPVLWMKMKWRFRKLNYFWDPDFKENEFLRGARQAVVTITHLIGDNNFDDLKGLLTKEALQKLRQEVALTWPDVLKQHIPLSTSHIKAVTPINVRMMENVKTGKRFCDIDILYIALKRIMQLDKGYHRILVFNILSRFHRNYSDGEIPNWTVAIFTMDVVAHKTTS